MFKLELKRYLKSKATLVVVVLILVSLISFASSYEEKTEFIEMYQTSTDEDLSMERLKMVIDNYTGLMFFIDFMEGEFSCLEIMVLLMWTGIFLSSVLLEHKNNGYGNHLVTRMGYKKYALTQLLTQSVYILIVIGIATVAQIVVACFIGGFEGCSIYVNGQEVGTWGVIIYIVVQMLIVWLHIAMFNGITLMISMVVKNKYFLQACPIGVFCVLPIVLDGIINDSPQWLADFAVYMRADEVMKMVSTITQNRFRSDIVIMHVTVMVMYAVILVMITAKNIERNKRNYV